MVPSRFTNLPAARARFGDRVDRLGAYLTQGDPLADEAVSAMDGIDGGAGWDFFARMARDGPQRVPEAPGALRAFFAQVSRVPVWVDWDLVHRGGQLLVRAGPLGGLVLGLKSLVLAYASPAGNKPLVLSGRLIEQAASRLNETARFVGATIAPEGLRPQGVGWQITLKVRLIHARIRRMIQSSGRWDEQAWGIPINQHDEAGTLLLFSVAVLEGLRTLGLHIPREDAEAYIHLWRWSGWLIGVDPELLPATETEGHRLADIMRATEGPPDDDSRALTRALLESPRSESKRSEAEAAEGSGPARAGEVAKKTGATALSSTLCRALVGDALANALGVPASRWPSAVPAGRQLISAIDFVRRSVPGGDHFALREGQRYWDRVAVVGLKDATAEFAVPTGLTPSLLRPRRGSERRGAAAPPTSL